MKVAMRRHKTLLPWRAQAWYALEDGTVEEIEVAAAVVSLEEVTAIYDSEDHQIPSRPDVMVMAGDFGEEQEGSSFLICGWVVPAWEDGFAEASNVSLLKEDAERIAANRKRLAEQRRAKRATA